MWQKHKFYWLQKFFVYNVLTGLIFLVAAFFVNQYANSYIHGTFFLSLG